jgi:hypothetical protein
MALQSKGNFMCLLRVKAAIPKGEPLQKYGVLLHNMTENMYYGTCLMNDGRLLTISWDKLHQAFKRINQGMELYHTTIETKRIERYVSRCLCGYNSNGIVH